MSAAEPRILIVYASQHGGTVQLVEAVERGAQREPGTLVQKLHGASAQLDDLLWCDAVYQHRVWTVRARLSVAQCLPRRAPY